MISSTKKAGISITLGLLISLIAFALILLVDISLFNQGKDALNETEFLNCKYSIDISQGIDLDSETRGIIHGIQPIPLECTPKIIDDELFNNAEDSEAIERIIINKMRIAWWATGKGEHKNIWKDSGKLDKLCKVMYYFELDEEAGKKLNDGKIHVSKIKLSMEEFKLPKIGATLYDYILSSSGAGKRYHVLLEADGVVNNELADDVITDDVVYGIIISSDPRGFNELILTTIPKGQLEVQVKNFINNKFHQISTGEERDLCDQMVDFNDNRARLTLI